MKQTAFEFGPNLLEVQTGLEKSDKFRKILIWLELPKCEFSFPWFYGKICIFHTSSLGLGLKIKKEGFEFEFKLNQATCP
jgi:hypothetical protein